jgi:hypothetical protein
MIRVHTSWLLAALLVMSAAHAAPGGRIALPDLRALEAKASEVVDVTLDANLLGLASRFLDANNPEEAAAKSVVSGLQGVYVRSFTFEEDYSLPQSDINTMRKQLAAPGWSRIVSARSRKENTNVEVYVLVERDQAKGLAVLAIEPRSFTIVNIVGAVDLEKLHRLEGQLGVPKLQIETAKGEKKPAAR